MRILITGGAGNVGSSLAHALTNHRHEVVVFDNLSTGAFEKIPKAATFVKGDCNHLDDILPVMLFYKFNIVFHYAAVVGVKRTLDNPLSVLEDLEGIRNVLHLSKSTSVGRVVFSSSSEVYGEPVHIPQHEELTPLNSRLPYAIVKNAGEAYFKSYYQEHHLPYTIFRFFNTYGPAQSEDFVVPRFVRSALRGEDLVVYGDGSQSRTFCFIDDNIETTVKMAMSANFENQTVNIGNDVELSVLELAKLIIRKTNSSSSIVHAPPLPEGDMTRRCPDISKMKAALGRPLTGLEEGVQRLIESFGRSCVN